MWKERRNWLGNEKAAIWKFGSLQQKQVHVLSSEENFSPKLPA
jgi:hypothetical protein